MTLPSPHPLLPGFQPDAIASKLPDTVKVYVVGGAVRDALLGRPAADRDWVVVGATPEIMVAHGFKPVGADFPVFLHPVSHEEYALARTERKSGHGYKGFVFHASPDVTIEEDLIRRDFTINAMAMDAEGRLLDPFGGLQDLQNRCLRHVSDAFAEDPLRVLRLARFLARFHDFEVARATQTLCSQLVRQGELEHLVPERTYAELNKGFSESKPSRMLQFLSQLGAWGCMPGTQHWPASYTQAELLAIDDVSSKPLGAWLMALALQLSPQLLGDMGTALRMPADLQDYLRVCAQLIEFVRAEADTRQASVWLEFLTRVDVYRKPNRLIVCVELLREQRAMLNTALSIQPPFAVLKSACEHQLNGQFKSELRTHMAETQAQGIPAAQASAQFRLQWVNALLQSEIA